MTNVTRYYIVVSFIIPSLIILFVSIFDWPGSCSILCHDAGCYHTSVLPDTIVGKDSIYTKTLLMLHSTAKFVATRLEFSNFYSYQILNILVFVVSPVFIHFLFWRFSLALASRSIKI